MEPLRFVYILRSESNSNATDVGLTGDVARRLDRHNNGPSGVTIHHRPWSLVSLEFSDAKNADRFERYLKTGSGRAFAKRHFGAAPGHQLESGAELRLGSNPYLPANHSATSQVLLPQRVAEFDFRCFGLAPGRPAAICRRNLHDFNGLARIKRVRIPGRCRASEAVGVGIRRHDRSLIRADVQPPSILIV